MPCYGVRLNSIFPSNLKYDGKIVREISPWSETFYGIAKVAAVGSVENYDKQLSENKNMALRKFSLCGN